VVKVKVGLDIALKGLNQEIRNEAAFHDEEVEWKGGMYRKWAKAEEGV
jgi:hypothetical protein